MRQPNRHNPTQRHSAGITLVETVLSLLILGGAFVAALNTISSARAAQALVSQRQLGLALAQDLMAEILAAENYKEGSTFGPEAGEAFAGRSAFDDIDDYHAWQSTPPTNADGTAIAGAPRFTRSATVEYVQLTYPTATSPNDEGLARITVTVKAGNKTLATLTAYRTDQWTATQEVH